ncbi:OmpH family outer membrane protein [candidate division TA06 bacterium]|nr:OmpH family outer membrane protein [candidate division TA06 bacterium]
MNRIRFFLALTAMMLVGAAWCQAQKTGYVDSKKIFENYKGAADIKQQVNRALDTWNKEIEAKRAEIDSLQRYLESQNLVISSERRKFKQDEIKAKSKEVETLIHQVYDPEGKLDARNKELSKPMVEKIGAIIKKVALDNNILLVLDSSSGMVVYADKDLDLTDQVLEELAKAEGIVAQYQPTLALFPVWDADPEAVRKKLGKMAFGYLFSSLGRSETFKPLAQKLVRDLVKDKGLEDKEVSDARGMELAKILTAQFSISGGINYNAASGQITLKLRLFNVDTGMMLAEESEVAASQTELSGACENLVTRLAQKAGGK